MKLYMGRILTVDAKDSIAAYLVENNGNLLNKLHKKLEILRGYHPDTGEMNQEAFFAVSNYITNSISIPDLI